MIQRDLLGSVRGSCVSTYGDLIRIYAKPYSINLRGTIVITKELEPRDSHEETPS